VILEIPHEGREVGSARNGRVAPFAVGALAFLDGLIERPTPQLRQLDPELEQAHRFRQHSRDVRVLA
jgi:hypothetical protein